MNNDTITVNSAMNARFLFYLDWEPENRWPEQSICLEFSKPSNLFQQRLFMSLFARQRQSAKLLREDTPTPALQWGFDPFSLESCRILHKATGVFAQNNRTWPDGQINRRVILEVP